MIERIATERELAGAECLRAEANRLRAEAARLWTKAERLRPFLGDEK